MSSLSAVAQQLQVLHASCVAVIHRCNNLKTEDMPTWEARGFGQARLGNSRQRTGPPGDLGRLEGDAKRILA